MKINLVIITLFFILGVFILHSYPSFTGFYVRGPPICEYLDHSETAGLHSVYYVNSIYYDYDTNDGISGKTYTDGCVNERVAYKHGCSVDQKRYYKYAVDCSLGSSCDAKKGVCIKDTGTIMCSDSNSNNELYESGTVTLRETNGNYFNKGYLDICLNKHRKKAFFCSQERVLQKTLLCPTNYHCEEGACVEN